MTSGNGNGNGHANRKVLVVEDDPEINRLVGAYVEFAGYKYLSALDGHQALAEIRDQIPCAIVLDLMLPDVSGLEVCRRVKNDALTQHIPVIILTALDSEDSRHEAMRCRAAEFVTKPFDPDHLLGLLTKHAKVSGKESAGRVPMDYAD